MHVIMHVSETYEFMSRSRDHEMLEKKKYDENSITTATKHAKKQKTRNNEKLDLFTDYLASSHRKFLEYDQY